MAKRTLLQRCNAMSWTVDDVSAVQQHSKCWEQLQQGLDGVECPWWMGGTSKTWSDVADASKPEGPEGVSNHGFPFCLWRVLLRGDISRNFQKCPLLMHWWRTDGSWTDAHVRRHTSSPRDHRMDRSHDFVDACCHHLSLLPQTAVHWIHTSTKFSRRD